MAWVFANRYECVSRLGSGQFGSVWRAFDRNLGREVALKLLQIPGALDLAILEAHALTALESPHVLRVLNAGMYQDIPYLVTEVAPLGSTADVVPALGVGPDVAVRWVRHVLVGLSVCHLRGLLHRDIKPANVFLSHEDHAQLGDFGVTCLAGADGRGPPHGDARVRPPECWGAGAYASAASDIYAVGVTLYTLIAGSFPFTGNTASEVEQAVLARTHTAIRDAAPHVGQALGGRIAKAMHPDPSQRYASASEMHLALSTLPRTAVSWSRRESHSGHECCWSGEGTNSGGYEVCVELDGARRHIHVRRATGARSRVVRFCKTVASTSARDVHLRRVFHELAR